MPAKATGKKRRWLHNPTGVSTPLMNTNSSAAHSNAVTPNRSRSGRREANVQIVAAASSKPIGQRMPLTVAPAPARNVAPAAPGHAAISSNGSVPSASQTQGDVRSSAFRIQARTAGANPAPSAAREIAATSANASARA